MRETLTALADRRLVLDSPQEILDAAQRGRVERLYIDRLDSANQDIINRAALAVIRNSGGVIFAESLNTPLGVAAELRYRSPEATANTIFTATA